MRLSNYFFTIFMLLMSVVSSFTQDYKITNLGSPVNSAGDDYAPVISPDGMTLFYASVRDGSILTEKGEPSHDFWVVKRTSKDKLDFQIPYNLDPAGSKNSNSLNTPYHEGVATFSPDGKRIYFTACGRKNNYGSCDIYMVEKTKQGWSKAKNLGGNVNSTKWNAQPSISPDGSRLYFVSNRPGPNGNDNMDIWYSDYDSENDEWLEAINLKDINTSGKECGPFIAPDNVTLFFSSDKYKPNLGGIDFYLSRYNLENKTWGQPAHLSSPISTTEDDIFISLPATGDVMFFSSKREDVENSQGNLDIFAVYTKSLFNAIVLKITVKDEQTGEYIYSNITVKNPLTGRIVNDEISPENPVLDLVVADTDFGTMPDSVRFVDWELTAENDSRGKVSKTLRIENPRHPEFNDFRAFADNLGITLEFAVKTPDENAQRVDSPDQSILTAYNNLIAFQDDKQVKLDTIKIRQQEIFVSKPLLNYIFFDENSSTISNRYVEIGQDRSKSFKLESFNNNNPLDIYKNILNIIGKRMNDIKDANLKLVGCNMDFAEEKGNTGLSQLRAETLKNYLTNIWGINSDRISIQSRGLPEKSSNNSLQEGRQENRRVEISSDYSEILAPIFTKDTTLVVQPETIRFINPVDVKFGEAFWTISIFDRNNVYKEFFGEGATNHTIEWQTKDLSKSIKFEKDLKYEVVVNDKKIRKTIVSKDSIPIIFDKLDNIQKNKEIEKYSLMLFDFGSNRIEGANKRVIETINSRIKKNSLVKILGYTDSIGDDSYNLRLSKSRAAEASKLIKHSNTKSQGIGEQELLYDNSTPEGRFYCRTVEITIETPVK